MTEPESHATVAEVSEKVKSGFLSLIQSTASLIGAVTICSTFAFYALQPRFDAYIVGLINLANKNVDTMQVVEFKGVTLVGANRVFAPGDPIRLVYLMRKNFSCSTIHEQQFINQNGVIDTRYTGIIPGTRSGTSDLFGLQMITITLPNPMENGFYSYSSVVDAAVEDTRCFGKRPIITPPTEYFEVRSAA